MVQCIIPRFAIFIVKFLYFQVFHNFDTFTLNWYSRLFKMSVFAATVSLHCMSVRKRISAEKPIAIRESNWPAMAHYLLSVSNSYEQNFSSREFRGIFESKKVCIRQNKKKQTSPACFNRVLWKALRKKYMLFIGFSKKKLFGTLPPLLNKPLGFKTKLLEKTVQR